MINPHNNMIFTTIITSISGLESLLVLHRHAATFFDDHLRIVGRRGQGLLDEQGRHHTNHGEDHLARSEHQQLVVIQYSYIPLLNIGKVKTFPYFPRAS